MTLRILSFIVSFFYSILGAEEGDILCLAVQSKKKDFIPPNFRIKILIIFFQTVLFFKVQKTKLNTLKV